MKKKFLTNTYLRGVDNYVLMQFEDDKLDCYSVLKKVNSIDKPYISTHTGKDVCLSKEGYFTVEYLPKNKNYGVRVFLDDNKNVISYYIDIIDGIGVDYEKGLFYDDLYLDITIDKTNNDDVKVWDEVDLAYNTLKEMLSEIAMGSNIYINNDHKTYIEEHFKI